MFQTGQFFRLQRGGTRRNFLHAGFIRVPRVKHDSYGVCNGSRGRKRLLLGCCPAEKLEARASGILIHVVGQVQDIYPKQGEIRKSSPRMGS